MNATSENAVIEKEKKILKVHFKTGEIEELTFLGYTASGRVKLPRKRSAVKQKTVMYGYYEYEEKAKEALKSYKARNIKPPTKSKSKVVRVWQVMKSRPKYTEIRGKIVGSKLYSKCGIVWNLDNDKYNYYRETKDFRTRKFKAIFKEFSESFSKL